MTYFIIERFVLSDTDAGVYLIVALPVSSCNGLFVVVFIFFLYVIAVGTPAAAASPLINEPSQTLPSMSKRSRSGTTPLP